MLELRNPHSILATLKKRPTAVERIVAPFQGGDRGYWKDVIDEAKRLRIKVEQPEEREAKEKRERPRKGGGRPRRDQRRPPEKMHVRADEPRPELRW